MNDPEVYSRKWDEYHRRVKLYIVAWIVAIPGAMVTCGLLMSLVGLDSWPAGVVGVSVFGVIAVAANFYLGQWQCPACGHYFCKWLTWANPLAIQCVHCGLRRYSSDEQIDQQFQTLKLSDASRVTGHHA